LKNFKWMAWYLRIISCEVEFPLNLGGRRQSVSTLMPQALRHSPLIAFQVQ
jgi:hypothetical protein